jgi:hypothetical protein
VKNATTQYQQQQHRCNKDQVSLCSFLSLFSPSVIFVFVASELINGKLHSYDDNLTKYDATSVTRNQHQGTAN